MKILKPKICRVCKKAYTPYSSISKTCSIPCAIQLSKLDRVKKHTKVVSDHLKAIRKSDRDVKATLKTKTEWLREAQSVFNKFIRLRDAKLPCISCGRFHQGQNHAGHYRTTKAQPGLRFHEDNCHLQCSVCNNHRSGNIVEYRINLLDKIGQQRLAWLEGPHPLPNRTFEDIKAIKKEYALKVKELMI